MSQIFPARVDLTQSIRIYFTTTALSLSSFLLAVCFVKSNTLSE